jgi:hypothetical protein
MAAITLFFFTREKKKRKVKRVESVTVVFSRIIAAIADGSLLLVLCPQADAHVLAVAVVTAGAGGT